MKLTINTTKLKEMLSKSVKGASNDKQIAKTSLLAIELKDSVLSLTTTDGTNYLVITENNILGDSFSAVVNVDIFAKLISKLTCETVTLELHSNYLEVIGNGSYKIEIPVDDDGNPIVYSSPAKNMSLDNAIGTISNSTLRKILMSVKPSLATNMSTPCYTCCYAGDLVVATDRYKISSLNTKLFDKPRLISGDILNLLNVITDDTITVYSDEYKLLFISEHCSVFGVEPSGVDNFNIDAIKDFINNDIKSSCKLPKDALVQLLERLSLFIGEYDAGQLVLTFTPNELLVSSKTSTGTESIKYIESSNGSDFTCYVNLDRLLSQLKTQSNNIVELYYGDESSLKLIDDDLISIIGLLDD